MERWSGGVVEWWSGGVVGLHHFTTKGSVGGRARCDPENHGRRAKNRVAMGFEMECMGRRILGSDSCTVRRGAPSPDRGRRWNVEWGAGCGRACGSSFAASDEVAKITDRNLLSGRSAVLFFSPIGSSK